MGVLLGIILGLGGAGYVGYRILKAGATGFAKVMQKNAETQSGGTPPTGKPPENPMLDAPAPAPGSAVDLHQEATSLSYALRFFTGRAQNPRAVAAVAQYQRDANLPRQDGFYDDATRGSLLANGVTDPPQSWGSGLSQSRQG